jgi:hypothetical protein
LGGSMGGWVDGWVGRWVGGWMSEWMDERWIDGPSGLMIGCQMNSFDRVRSIHREFFVRKKPRFSHMVHTNTRDFEAVVGIVAHDGFARRV